MSSFPAPATPTARQAFALLSRTVLAAPAATITFSGLDTANKMFRLTVYVIKDATGGSPMVRLNNDSATNYDYQRLTGSSTTVSASRGATQAQIWLSVDQIGPNDSGVFGVVVAKQQTGDEALVVSEGSILDASSLARTEHVAGIWKNTAALISRVDLLVNAGNLAANTTAILEGNSTT